ncbi:hypothetical protein HMPREF3069_10520 [Achromobacter xylosoxidans]|nr:hypothetical protein HMPREF2772_05250 [Achromobacter xylosoxidans]OFS51666.1 hypothetical protein HMPREF3069_10520 [Achromobacter xylosoxidans]
MEIFYVCTMCDGEVARYGFIGSHIAHHDRSHLHLRIRADAQALGDGRRRSDPYTFATDDASGDDNIARDHAIARQLSAMTDIGHDADLGAVADGSGRGKQGSGNHGACKNLNVTAQPDSSRVFDAQW